MSMDRVRWAYGVGGVLLFGGLGWLVAGPLVAAPLVAWHLWRTSGRWDSGHVGVEPRDEGLVCVNRSEVASAVEWHRVAGFRLEQMSPPPGCEFQQMHRGSRDPVLPVADLTDGSQVELWPLAVSQHPRRPKNRSEPQRILRQLRDAHAERAGR